MSTLAERQLAAWQELARDWLWADDLSEFRLLCTRCGKSAILTADSHGVPYRYTAEQDLALKVLHLRNHHPDLDPDQPRQTL